VSGKLFRNAELNNSLSSALRSGEHGLVTVPGLIKRVLVEESWREFVTQMGEHVQYERFADFVATPPLKGLGSELSLIRRIVVDDPEALDLYDQAVQNPHGGDHASAESKNNNIQLAPQGTSKARALRKLRSDAPKLHAEVLAGNISAHAAMVQAGFRPKTFTVRADRPESVARTLRKHLTRDQLRELAEMLADEPPEQQPR
jgi:hypothetical protein